MSDIPPEVPQLPEPKRKRSSFLRDKYARVLTIRETQKDRATPRITKIPATLEAARARMMIVATKLVDQVEAKLNLLQDAQSSLTTKEYKEMIETLERSQEIMNNAFGVSTSNKKDTPAVPVNNGVIINGAPSDAMSGIMSRMAAAVVRKPIDLPRDTGADSGSP